TSEKKENSSLTLEISYGEELKLQVSQSAFPELWQKIQIKDELTGKLISYYGYPSRAFFEKLSTLWKIPTLHHIQTEALDGYKVNFPLESLNHKNSFLALKIEDLPKEGFYNKDIKAFHDWRPSYLLLGSPHEALFGSSPYQVHKIKIFDKATDDLFLAKVPKKFQEGALAYIKKCSKCHSHKGYGGMKAPPISVMTVRWPKDEEFKKFLANPQQMAKRQFEMSAYEGTPEELDQLLLFLRHIEAQLY
ncbi:MAG: cytochrome c, partial [Bdellovibrionales bacterium]|nr:cytochrome c [Bdellovibrionales bacterium]